MSSSTVTLRPLSEQVRGLRFPPNPSSPPSAADMAQSALFKHQMIDLLKLGKATNDDVMACIDYENALLGSRQGAAPPWFESAMARHLDPIREDIKTLKDDYKTLKDDVKTLKDDYKTLKDDVKTLKEGMNASKIQQNRTLRIAALTFNKSQPFGADYLLEAVPNEHGADLPLALPALTSRKVIRELSPQQQRDWLQYYVPRQRNLGSRPIAQVIADLTSQLGISKDLA